MKIERTRIHVFSSLGASPPIWASETSLARERAAKPKQESLLAGYVSRDVFAAVAVLGS